MNRIKTIFDLLHAISMWQLLYTYLNIVRMFSYSRVNWNPKKIKINKNPKRQKTFLNKNAWRAKHFVESKKKKNFCDKNIKLNIDWLRNIGYIGYISNTTHISGCTV